MFACYDPNGRKRKRNWGTTVAVSVLAHGAAIAAIVGFAQQAEAKAVTETVIAEWNLEEKPTPPPPPPPKVELPPEPKEPPKVDLAPEPEPETQPVRHAPPPAPVKGDFVTPRPPETTPVGIPAPDMNARPVTQADVSGVGKEGDVVGQVDPSDTRAPTGNTEPSESKEATPAPAPEPEPVSDEPVAESEVDVRPSLRNADDVQRALERAYPPSLRDAGVTGQTVMQFVIDENGRVEPSSVEIVSSSDEAFASAARRIVSSMRFTPAKIRGHTVRVMTTLPVSWTIAG